jgi:hypothetical protein
MTDLQKLRSYIAALEGILAKSHGGWADDESLLEFRRSCWAALLVINDKECQEHIALLVQYAKELFSERDHHRWDVGPMFGVDILRRKIRMQLSSFSARLNSVERGHSKRWQDLRAA